MSAQPTIDELLDQAVRALNRGDRPTADAPAGQVLQVDRGNADAEELLAALTDSGEIRRMTIIFADLVDSTALSTRLEPEVYRTVVGRYRDEVLRIVDRYEGHVGSTKGDGLLAVFGHPKAHENDVRRAVLAGLDITREVSTLSERVRTRFRRPNPCARLEELFCEDAGPRRYRGSDRGTRPATSLLLLTDRLVR